jgi:Phage integrase family
MSVYKPKGREEYIYDFWLDGRRFFGPAGSEKREALKVEASAKDRARALIKAQPAATSGPLTLDIAIGRYWAEWGQHQKNSKDLWRDFCRLSDYLGKDKLLSDITDNDVAKLVAWRRGHRIARPFKTNAAQRSRKLPLISPAQVNRTTTEMLRRLFVRARKKWKIRYDSEPDWSEHFLEEPEERVRELRADEDAALEAQMDPDYEALRRFSLACGMRRNESLLQWPQVDLQGRRITTAGKGGRQVFLPISSEMFDILLSRRGHHPEFVFTYVCKRASRSPVRVIGERYPITAEGVKTHWRRRRAKSGVKDFRWHDNRHDFCTKLLRATNNLKLVQRGANHKNIATTAKYAHVVDDDLRAGMEAMAQNRDEKSQQNSQHLEKSKRFQR